MSEEKCANICGEAGCVGLPEALKKTRELTARCIGIHGHLCPVSIDLLACSASEVEQLRAFVAAVRDLRAAQLKRDFRVSDDRGTLWVAAYNAEVKVDALLEKEE